MMRRKNIKSIVDISDFAYLHARGGSTAAARASFFERSIQLSTTGIFCRFKKNVVLLSTTSEKYGFWVKTKYST